MEMAEKRRAMKKFGNVELKLGKDVKKGDKESLLSLFRSAERYKPIDVLTNADEDVSVKVVLEGLGETDLKLGDDMEKGERRDIMTLFWYAEKSKPIEMRADAAKGDNVTIDFFILND